MLLCVILQTDFLNKALLYIYVCMSIHRSKPVSSTRPSRVLAAACKTPTLHHHLLLPLTGLHPPGHDDGRNHERLPCLRGPPRPLPPSLIPLDPPRGVLDLLWGGEWDHVLQSPRLLVDRHTRGLRPTDMRPISVDAGLGRMPAKHMSKHIHRLTHMDIPCGHRVGGGLITA